MSLLGGSVNLTGDIWSTGAFSFESPLKDLLDSKDYTLEQLLAEDELLQELRGLHPVLIEYFSSEKSLTKLIRYITLPPSPPENSSDDPKPEAGENGIRRAAVNTTAAQRLHRQLEKRKSAEKVDTPESDPEFRHIRFPFMSCEIFCCEIDGIINTLVDGFVAEDESDNGETAPAAESEGEATTPVVARTRLLDLFFNVLYDTPPGQLDDYRAGYFDKILSLLFRKRGPDLSNYINSGGDRGQQSLMEAMMKHLYSHSIMQICQRLLLPPRPTPKQSEVEQPIIDATEKDEDDEAAVAGGQDILAGEEDDGENGGGIKCDWSKSGIAIEMLLQRLISPEVLLEKDSQLTPVSAVDTDQSIEEQRLSLSFNASEVLITVIQNSMLSSDTMLTLTSFEVMQRLTAAATTLKEGEPFPSHESLLTSAMNVVESLILQLGGYGAVGTMSILEQAESQDQDTNRTLDSTTPLNKPEGEGADGIPAAPSSESDADQSTPAEAVKDGLIADLTSLLQVLPSMLEGFAALLRHPSTRDWRSPVQFSKSEPVPLLGTSRLRIVRVLESLVLLGDPTVDSKLVQSDCLLICLDLFWEFQWCSMLHQSVANLLVHVFEGQNVRFEIQEYFIAKCNLIGRLMNSFVEVTDPRVHTLVMDLDRVIDNTEAKANEMKEEADAEVLPVSEDDIDAALEKQEEDKAKGEQKGVSVDNVDLVSTEAVNQESRDASTVGISSPAQSFRFGYMGHVIIICQALVQACAGNEWAAEQQGEGMPQMQQDGNTSEPPSVTDVPSNDAAGKMDEPLMIAELVNNHELADRWQEFVISALATEIAVQSTPLGGLGAQPTDPLQAHRPETLNGRRPGLADDGMGDGDGAMAPLPPRGMLTASDINDIDDSDLEVAANLVAGLNLGRPTTDDGSDGSGFSGSSGSGDSGEAASGGYKFDDPLGKAGGSLGIELGKLQFGSGTNRSGGNQNDDSDEDNSSSDEEPENRNDEDDVPVMDLFAGNFNHSQNSPGDEKPDGASFDFANFENAFDSNSDDAFGAFESAPAPETAPAAPSSGSEENDAEDIFGGSGSNSSLLDDLTEIPYEPPKVEGVAAVADPSDGGNDAVIVVVPGADPKPEPKPDSPSPGEDMVEVKPTEVPPKEEEETPTSEPTASKDAAQEQEPAVDGELVAPEVATTTSEEDEPLKEGVLVSL